jgi:homoserine O-succinyltransferase/O-acetyltransferase
MPFCSNPNFSIDRKGSRGPLSNLLKTAEEQSANCVSIGLINNMPDGALEATERQFRSLLESASSGIEIRLTLYSLPGIHRSGKAERHVERFYSSADSLLNAELDGLIVTGREPLAPNLPEEPYWDSFTRILEWARYNTYATVWSCLAAHAALLHLDGIDRIKSQKKHCGVFEFERVDDHPLMAATPPRLMLPHSRWNGLPEEALRSSGYKVLTRAADIGVDTFVKQYKSLFVFFQGHPEYEADTLLLEYRRDVGRYLREETNAYPLIPRGYFDSQTSLSLARIADECMSRSRRDVMDEVSDVLGNLSIESAWHATATSIFRNWLDHICAEKRADLTGTQLSSHYSQSPDELPVQLSS